MDESYQEAKSLGKAAVVVKEGETRERQMFLVVNSLLFLNRNIERAVV